MDEIIECGGEHEQERGISKEYRKTEVIRELLAMLDYVEESDNGNIFHPTRIATCRVMHQMKLEKLIPEIKELFK